MSKRMFVLGVFLLTALTGFGCKQRQPSKATTNAAAAPTDVKLMDESDKTHWLFTGVCAAASEACGNVCLSRGEGRYIDVERSQELCGGYAENDRVACVCGLDKAPRAIPPRESEYAFKSCQTSAPACASYCENSRFIPLQNSHECAEILDFACYCKK